jgi:hypothetical protein
MPLLEQFYLAAELPERGPYRLKVLDVSELGVGFACDGSEIESWFFEVGDAFPLHLFLNQRLYFPLKVRVAQLHPDGKSLRVGAEILKNDSEGYEALQAFLRMLDAIPPSVKKKLSVLR